MSVLMLMGSISDEKIAKKAWDILNEFGVETKVKVASAHRSLDIVLEAVQDENVDVVIAFAGKAAHLAGVVAGATVKPVIGVPILASSTSGFDALLSTVQMPKGVPVATVAIDGAENAAYLAIQMLALKDETLHSKLIEFKQNMIKEVEAMDARLEWSK